MLRLSAFGLGAATMTTAMATEAETSVHYTNSFMADPVTPKSILIENKDDIKVKMELFIMKIQVGYSYFFNWWCQIFKAEFYDFHRKNFAVHWKQRKGKELNFMSIVGRDQKVSTTITKLFNLKCLTFF